MGEVFLARDDEGSLGALKRLVPALELDDSFRRRFLREAKTHQQLSHQGVAEVLDHFEKDGKLYLVTEYLERGSLQDELDRNGARLPQARALRWVAEALEGLDYSHQRGVIHRDVKPSNLLLTAEGRCKVTDFGIARVLHSQDRLTFTGQALGTPKYMSPEQINEEDVDHRTDVYSMGIVLYELLTGRVPFGQEKQLAVWTAQVHEAPPSMGADVPSAVEAIVMKALRKDPGDRHPGCGEFARVIRRYLEEIEEPKVATAHGSLPGAGKAMPRWRKLPPWVFESVVLRAAVYIPVLCLLACIAFYAGFYGLLLHRAGTSARNIADSRGVRMLTGQIERSAVPESILRAPNLLGEEWFVAEKVKLPKKRIRMGRGLSVFCQEGQPGLVTYQSPAPGTPIRADDQMDVFVCQERQMSVSVMPDLVFRQSEEVISFFENRGFEIGRISYDTYPGRPPGTVLRQFPLEGHPLRRGDVIYLDVISAN